MQITARILRNWADEGGIPDLTLAELDYRLVHALRAIYTNPFLRDRLYLKGGHVLEKILLLVVCAVPDVELILLPAEKMRDQIEVGQPGLAQSLGSLGLVPGTVQGQGAGRITETMKRMMALRYGSVVWPVQGWGMGQAMDGGSLL